METILYILLLMWLSFLIGYIVNERKYHRKISAAIDYERNFLMCNYRDGWLDCVKFILKK